VKGFDWNKSAMSLLKNQAQSWLKKSSVQSHSDVYVWSNVICDTKW
jgi:hypothetical protein